MSAHIIPFPSPFQPHHNPNQGQDRTAEASLHESFVSRAASVDRLVDDKARLVMESSRLRALAESNPEHSEGCYSLVQELEENINRLQEQIDLELKGLFYGLQKAPAPSAFLDALPG